MKIILKLSLGIILSAILLFSCDNNSSKIDVSDIKIDFELERFEKDLFAIKLDSIDSFIPDLEKKYGEFFEIFNYKIIKIGGTNVKAYPQYLYRFLTDDLIVEIYDKTEKQFIDFNIIENNIKIAFKHFKFYFPTKKIPNIYTYISGFNQSIVISDTLIGIGLDKYFGANCDYYSKMTIPNFSKYKMSRNNIVPDLMKAWAMAEFPYNDSLDNVLNQMIYNGKIMYFLDKVLPDAHDSTKIAYTTKQIDWCNNSENEMWTYLVENKILFKSEYMEIKRYIDDGPFTPSFPRQSPARTGVWIGWQIVRSYMKNNDNISLEDLMKDEDYQRILNFSKYRP